MYHYRVFICAVSSITMTEFRTLAKSVASPVCDFRIFLTGAVLIIFAGGSS